MATLYDLLPDSTKAAYPLETLTPKWQQRLGVQVPPDYPAQYAQSLSGALAERAPRMTVVHEKVRAVQRAMAGKAPPIAGPTPDYRTRPSGRLPGPTTTAEDVYGRTPTLGKVAMRLAEIARTYGAGAADLGAQLGYHEANRFRQPLAVEPPAPPEDLFSSQSAPIVPPPRPWSKGGTIEHLTDIAGNTVPFVAGAAAGGVPGMAAVAATPPGTIIQRLARAGTTAVAAPLSRVTGQAIAGESPGLTRTLASHLPGAALFGAAQPWAAERVSSLLGQPSTPLTADEAIRGGLEMYLVNLLFPGAGGVGEIPRSLVRGEQARVRQRMASRLSEQEAMRERGVVPPAEAANAAAMGRPAAIGPKHVSQQASLLAEAARAPAGMDFKARNSSERLSQNINNTLGGKVVRLLDPDTGKELVAKIHSVFVYRAGDPEAGARHVRVIAEDSNGHLAPLHYKTVEDFTHSVVGPHEPEMAAQPQTAEGPQALPPQAPEKPAPRAVKPPPEIPETQVPEEPRRPAPAKPEELPTSYQSRSRGGEIPINRMAGEHLQNAHAIEPEGPVKQALAAEIARRGLKPKPAKPPRVREPVVQPPRDIDKEAEQRRLPEQDLFKQNPQAPKPEEGERPTAPTEGTRGRAPEPVKPPPPTKRSGEPTTEDIHSALQTHFPGELERLAEHGATDEELDALVHKALKADGWDVGGENDIALLKAAMGPGPRSREEVKARLQKRFPDAPDEIIEQYLDSMFKPAPKKIDHFEPAEPHTDADHPVYSEDEARAVLGYHGNTAEQSLREVEKNGTPAERLVARRVREALGEQGADNTKVYVVHSDMKPSEIASLVPVPARTPMIVYELREMARGAGTLGAHLGGAGLQHHENVVFLNGTYARARGVGRRVLLHEQIHNAAKHLIDWGLKELRNPNSPLGSSNRERQVISAVSGLERLYLHVINETILRNTNKTLDPATAKFLNDSNFLFEQGNPDAGIHELMAWGLTDHRAQDYLESISYPQHASAWTAFVDTMRRLLGLKPREATAFTELMRVSDMILERSFANPSDHGLEVMRFAKEGGGARFATDELRARLGVKKKLPQLEMEGLGERTEKPAKLVPEAKNAQAFHDTFWEKVRDPMHRNTSPITLAEEAAKESGVKVPDGFDPTAEVARVRAKALAEAGQGDAFAAAGVEIPKPRKAEDKPAVAREMAMDAAAQTVDDAGGEHLAPPEMKRVKASDLSILPGFQKREGVTEGDFINPRIIAQHLEPSPKNPQGGYNQALMDQSPVTIWTDTNGAFGEAGKTYILDGHHRRYLASNTFGKRGEDYVRTGKADREMNAVEVFVTPEQAQQIAEFANRRTARTSYVEDARLATRLADEGKSIKEIASALGTKQSEAERAANIGRLDPAVREFFADEAMRTHGGHLGAAVAAHPDYFNAIRQRQLMRQINDGQYGSAIEFAASLKQERGLLERLNQLDMGNDFGNAGFTPQQVKEATNRGLRYVESIKTALSRQLAALKAIEKAGGDASAVKLLADKVSADRERAKALEKSLNPHDLFDRIARGLRAGVPAEKTLQIIKDEIDLKLGPETPADHIPAGSDPQLMHSFEGFSPEEKRLAEVALPELWRSVLRGQPGAIRGAIRRIPRGERLKTVDAQGRTVERYDGKSLYEPDYYSESALVRLMTHAKLLGGNFVLPRDNAVDLKAGYAEEALHMHRWNWRRMELIGEKAARLMGPFSNNSQLVSRVLSGRAKVEDLPKDLRHVPDAVRTLTSEIFAYVNKVRKQMGMEPVRALEGYDLPHMITGKASELVDSLLQSFLGGVDVKQRQKALEEMRNRFFEHRNNHQRWVEDAALQLDAYISVMSRYAALAPVLRRLGADIAHMENEDPIRAGLVSDWLKATLLRRKTKVDNILDNTARALFYAKNEPQAATISPRRAAEILFPEQDSRKMGRRLAGDYKKFFLVPEGVDFEVSPGRDTDLMGKPRKGATVLHTDKFGRKLIGTQGETVFTGIESPKLRKPFEAMGKLGVEVGHAAREGVQALSGGKIHTRPEGMTAQEAKDAAYREWRQRIVDAQHSPGAAWFQQMGGNQMRAVLGWNFRAMIANWFQPYITSAPEYGLLPVLKASARVSGGTVMRRLVDLAEKRGYITTENAAGWRRVFQDTKQRAMQLGSLQGEVMSAREQLLHPTLEPYQKIAEVAGPMYGYRLIEDFTRGVNVLGSEALARRYGLDPAVAWRYHKEMGDAFFEDWANTVRAMRTKGTAERLQSILDSETMFDYNALGQAPIFGGSAGKLLGRLMTFPANFFPRYLTRPVGGALKVGAAVARGTASALTGGRIGKVAPRPERAVSRTHALPYENKYLVRGEYPAPVNGAERWLEAHGAHFHDRQAMRVFLTQAVTVGLMHALTESTGVNALLPGTPGWDVLLTLLAYSMDPHNKKLKAALERARQAAIISPERGVEVGMSPALRLAWQFLGPENTGATWARAQKRAKQGQPVKAAGEIARPVGDALAEFLREQIPGLVAFRRSIQNAVEIGPVPSAQQIARTPATDIVGTRSYVKNRSVGQMVKGNLGLTPTDEEARRRKIIKKGGQ